MRISRDASEVAGDRFACGAYAATLLYISMYLLLKCCQESDKDLVDGKRTIDKNHAFRVYRQEYTRTNPYTCQHHMSALILKAVHKYL